jgi:hypothetical protein
VADQWEGVMATSEHEFDLLEGQHIETGSHVQVHYDYVNRKFATRDPMTGRRSVSDYAAGLSFTVDESGTCRVMRTGSGETMRRICFTSNVDKLGTADIGGELSVTLRQFSEPGNVTVRTIVTTQSCIPVYEEIIGTETDYVSITRTLYIDVSLGIHDMQVFNSTGSNCQPVHGQLHRPATDQFELPALLIHADRQRRRHRLFTDDEPKNI